MVDSRANQGLVMRNGRIKQLVKEVSAFLLDHPDATEDEIRDGVSERIRTKYGSAWAIILVSLLEVLLPVILEWLNKEEDA